jgi:hypothetical protein
MFGPRDAVVDRFRRKVVRPVLAEA